MVPDNATPPVHAAESEFTANLHHQAVVHSQIFVFAVPSCSLSAVLTSDSSFEGCFLSVDEIVTAKVVIR